MPAGDVNPMKRFNPFLAKIGSLIAAGLLICGGAAAQTIENTAQAQWRSNGLVYTTKSNTVTTIVNGLQSQLSVLPLALGTTPAMEIPGGQCAGSALPSVNADDASVHTPTSSSVRQLKLGQPIIFRLSLSPTVLLHGVADTLVVTLTSASGDKETITVTETGPDTGIFFGALPTSAIPPKPIVGDCRLSLADGDRISVTYEDQVISSLTARAEVEVLSDPYGLLFDSEDGSPISGAKVTLVDALTGQPAVVLGDDGRTRWPSTVTTGQDVVDGAGQVWPMPAGEYRFPLVALGQYRIVVAAPPPYSAPSSASPETLARLRRPDGAEMVLNAASYGGEVSVSSPAPVRIDVPLDRPTKAVAITKTASREVGQPGDTVFFKVVVANDDRTSAKNGVTLTDRATPQLRLRKESVQVDGLAPGAETVSTDTDGLGFRIELGPIGAGQRKTITYAMSIRQDASAGYALNRAETIDSRGLKAKAEASVRIERDNLAATMTLLGRVMAGQCQSPASSIGIAGVRIALEDGSFAVTDATGRFHFEGLSPGTHVAELQQGTLPAGAHLIDCAKSTRSAGSAASRFVTGQGGGLARADFVVAMPESAVLASDTASPEKGAPEREANRAAAGANVDWLAVGDGPTDFLFPGLNHNPRAPVVRVVIRHKDGERVELHADGKKVDGLAFDGTRKSAAGYAVSIWRGIPLLAEETKLEADIIKPDGSIAARLSRTVHFAATPAKVELDVEHSRLVADGTSRPVLAIKVLDRLGRPVHAGLAGTLEISAPYDSASAFDAKQAQVLADTSRTQPTWTVQGDDGVAFVELAPTMVSGRVQLDFVFTDGQVKRQQMLEAWLVPGDQKWTLIGIAEAALGARSVADNMQVTERFDSDLGDNARVAFYAKGKIQGRYLATVAYDSAKQSAEQRLLGGLDPNAYYTVFADGSDRRFDAASVRKLYIRVESDKVRAAFGDFVTGFDATVLSRYQRTLTGANVEARFGRTRVQAFAARTSDAHRRDEMPGAGVSGPYRLSSRRIVPNSETVTLEVRDRFRSEIVLKSEKLVRFSDYQVDLLAGSIQFKQPVLSRDENLNPRTIVVEYDVDTAAPGAWNSGARAEVNALDDALRLGATVITEAGQDTDAGSSSRTNLLGVDARARLSDTVEIRAEAAMSAQKGSDVRAAFLLEIERHDQQSDILAYVRSIEQDFGLGQSSVPEQGRRKVGLDARYRLTESFSLTASAALDRTLGEDNHREMVQVRGVWQTPQFEARLGLARYNQSETGAPSGGATLVEAGFAKRLLDNRLELTATGSFALGDDASSSWQPPKYRYGIRYAVTPSIRIVADREVSRSEEAETKITRAGFEVSPWTGARATTSIGQRAITEQGKRAFAAYGLAQSLPIDAYLTIDATIDGSKKLGGSDLVSTNRTAIAGSASSAGLAEDFTAYTVGLNWRSGLWSVSSRAEYRLGSVVDRRGFFFGALRQLGEGSVVGINLTVAQASEDTGPESQTINGAISLAHRPQNEALSFLAKGELRSDSLRQAQGAMNRGDNYGSTPIFGTENGRSTRLIGSLSTNWLPDGGDQDLLVQRNEVGLFAAVRYNLDSFEGTELSGTTLLGGADLRLGLDDRFEIGGTATARSSLQDGTMSFAMGPQVGMVPVRNALLILGYNFSGFHDRDFADVRNTRKGIYAAFRLKFESSMLAGLDLP